VLITM